MHPVTGLRLLRDSGHGGHRAERGDKSKDGESRSHDHESIRLPPDNKPE
jgi:hypothetical protein